jgi:hypothetical protein
LQFAPANATTKACQRVCLSKRTADIAAKLVDNEIKRQKSPVPNIVYKTLGFRWLNQAFCPASAFVSADRNEARTPQRFIHATVMPHPKRATVQKMNIERKLKTLRKNIDE